MTVGVGRKADFTAQVKTIWEDELYAQAEQLTFWHRFEGESDAPIVRKDELRDEPADTIKFDAILSLVEEGSTDEITLTEGNEEKLVMRQSSFGVDILKHGVRWNFVAEKMVTHRMRENAKTQLAKWIASRVDNRMWACLSGMTLNGYAPTLTAPGSAGLTGAYLPDAYRMAVGGPITDAIPGDIAAGDVLTLDGITELKALVSTSNLVEPIRLENGVEIYFLVTHPYALVPLKESDDYQSAMREAQVRGAENPLFTGAAAIWDGVVIFTSTRVPKAADGGSSAPTCRSVFFGNQLAARGWAMLPEWHERDFSYGEEAGVATRMMFGQRLITFDLNETETGADATDDTALGGVLLYTSAPTPNLA